MITVKELSDINDFLIDIGFKDVTNEKPINFHECIVSLDNVYPLSNRFYRKVGKLETYVNIGIDRNIIYIYIQSSFNNNKHELFYDLPVKYFAQHLFYFININEDKVILSYIQC